jgi:hypothetical protein
MPMLSGCAALVTPSESCTVTEKLEVPVGHPGVPEITPVLAFKFRLAGIEPLEIVQ